MKLSNAILLGAGLILAATASAETALHAKWVVDPGAMNDPRAAYWGNIEAAGVPMLGQMVATPRHLDPAVKELQVKAAHNGHRIAFLIEWADPARSDRIVVDEYGDQVAVELPNQFIPDKPPSPMMGHQGARVTILQWRAAFQKDLEAGEPQIRDLYPHALVDIYPDQVLRATDARPYMGAVGLDNPISHPNRTPVLDQMAEGWGTMTVKLEQRAEAKGLWQDGRWRVVISYPFSGGDNDPKLAVGMETVAAFAVWEGGAREVGSRKAWSNWVPLKIE
ncbi:MAG: ethylbenzene dehydrogenase-related protein [Sulfuricaulis sp.]|uniref:ethylbenzene dehydrogenase-related protein n=1 Tax=Sulfuricaulis sp. TaxID=2003553 RepID=UPI0025FAC308|nr:ethylbenzene dehydrogenase-related protein [Sulfuricaulis sp.]MCR4346636.1 ethylbenzene dehydrogenase-related protein [Sulfuricaulis sp.]